MAEVDVLQIVNENGQKVEPYADLVDEALIQHNIEVLHRENQSIAGESGLTDTGDIEETTESSENTIPDIPFKNESIYQNDDEISTNIRSLNFKQRQIFDFVYSWAKETVKQKSSKNSEIIGPFHLFFSGSAGVGKSHLVKTIY